MTHEPHIKRKLLIAGVVVVILAAVYTFLSVNAPRPPAAPGFEIGEVARIILQVTFFVPTFLIWYFGLRSSILLYEIARRDGESEQFLKDISLGIFLLILGLIVSSFLSQARTYLAASPEAYKNLTIIINYDYVLFPLIAFFMFFRSTIKNASNAKNTVTASILVGFFSLLWLAILFTNSSRQTTTASHLKPSFYIDDLLIITTIVIPTIIAWFYGISAALNLSLIVPYSDTERVRGFSRILSGIWLCLFASIFLNGLMSTGAERLIGTGLVGIIAIIYIFFILLVAAYSLLSSGSGIIYRNKIAHHVLPE